MAEGGARQDELVEGVRALLLGQRRLERLVADLVPVGSRGSPLDAPTADSLEEVGRSADSWAWLSHALRSVMREEMGSLLAEGGQMRCTVRSEVEAGQAAETQPPPVEHSSRDDGRPSPSQARSADQESVESYGHCESPSPRRAVWNEPIEKITIESSVWLSQVQVRQELLDIGSAEKLAMECSKEAFDETMSDKVVEELSKRSASKRNLDQSLKSSRRNRATHTFLSRLCHLAVLSPGSGKRACIDILSLIVLAYNLSSIPYFLAFDIDVHENQWLRGIENISVCFWSFDLLVNFRTGYYEDGQVQMDPAKIARHYLRGSFLLDIMTLSVDMMSVICRALDTPVSQSVHAQYFRVFKIWRIARLTGFLRIRALTLLVERLSAGSPHAGALAESAFKVFKFVLALVWINHVIACLWCFVGRMTTSDTDYTWMDLSIGSLDETLVYNDLGVSYEYLTALHWSLTQMTPGSMQVFPVNSAERVFNIFCLLGGLLVFSTLVSAISANVAQLKIEMQGHSDTMEKLDRFLWRSEIETDLRVQVCKQIKLRLMHKRPQVVKDLAVLDLLTPSLRNELQLALCNPHFLDHELLHFLSITDLALWGEICRTCVDFSILTDTLFTFKADAEGMYFIARGTLWYTMDRSLPGEPSEKVLPGKWLSEAALWCNWGHVGCAEVKGAAWATCEVLLLRAATLMPILLKRGLIGQLIWAYAVSFHKFLQQSVPPLFDLPNDLSVPFGADEVIAAMPKDATVTLGQAALQVLKAAPGTLLASWRHHFKHDNFDMLTAEMARGGSALLVTAKLGVVRCVPLVVLRLRRQDQRLFVRMRQTSSEDGTPKANCQLPGGKQEAGEDPAGCLQRLLRGKFRALANGLTVNGMERQSELEQSWHFGVPTRYVRTIVIGEWPGEADETLQEFLVTCQQPDDLSPMLATTTKTSRVFWNDVGHNRSRHPQKWPVEAFLFPTDPGYFYAWLTDEEFGFFNSPQGQSSLLGWLSGLSEAVEATEGPAAAGQEAGVGGAAPLPYGGPVVDVGASEVSPVEVI